MLKSSSSICALLLCLAGCGGDDDSSPSKLDSSAPTGHLDAALDAHAGERAPDSSAGLACTLAASDYSSACVLDSDCVNVYFGSLCTGLCTAANAAINVADMARYQQEVQQKTPQPPIRCSGGPCQGVPACIDGQCRQHLCGVALDGGRL